MRQSDYPLPSYAASVWSARGKFFLARNGKGTFYFEDSPDGLAELRVALLACADQRVPLGPAAHSGSNLQGAEASKARVKLTARGRPKLAAEDLWSGDGEAFPDGAQMELAGDE
jgi:hypothetical protein